MAKEFSNGLSVKEEPSNGGNGKMRTRIWQRRVEDPESDGATDDKGDDQAHADEGHS